MAGNRPNVSDRFRERKWTGSLALDIARTSLRVTISAIPLTCPPPPIALFGSLSRGGDKLEVLGPIRQIVTGEPQNDEKHPKTPHNCPKFSPAAANITLSPKS